MSTIATTSVHVVHRSAAATLATSYGRPAESRDHVVVVVGDEEGRTGWGEASALPFFTGETPASIRTVLEGTYLPLLVGKDALAIGAIHAELEHALPNNSSARAAIDMALHDLAAQSLGIPVSTLLGGGRRDRVPVTRPIGITTVDDAVARATTYVAAGHQTLKFKVGGDPRTDIERIRAVREAVGSSVKMRIDANQGYDLSSALRILRALEDVELEYFEQPLPRHDVAGLARLRSQVGTRIAVDEGLHDVRDAVALLRAGAVDVFVIKLIKVGGLLPAKRITDLGEAYGIASTVVSPFDTQIGAAHGLHLALTLPAGGPACELTVFSTQAEMATTGHRVVAGELVPSGAAGVGVDRLEELARAA